MPKPLSLKSQGQNADCETESRLESNYQFYYWDESVSFVVQLEELIGNIGSHPEIMVLASKVGITYSMEICQNPHCISHK